MLRSPFARLTLRAYDPDLAKQYLRDAGFPNGTTITIDAQILTAPSRRLSPRATGCSPPRRGDAAENPSGSSHSYPTCHGRILGFGGRVELDGVTSTFVRMARWSLASTCMGTVTGRRCPLERPSPCL